MVLVSHKIEKNNTFFFYILLYIMYYNGSKALTVTRINFQKYPAPILMLPHLPGMTDYTSIQWRNRAQLCFRLTKERKRRQEQMMANLRTYLRIRTIDPFKGDAIINGTKVSNIEVSDGLYIYYILNTLVQCPELVASNRDRFIWAYCWTAVSSIDNNLNKIDPRLYNTTLERIEVLKKDLREYLIILQTRSDYKL